MKEFHEMNVKERFNVSKYEPMKKSTRELLEKFFAPYNEELEKYLNEDFNWK